MDSPLQDWGAPHSIMLTTTTDYKKNFLQKMAAMKNVDYIKLWLPVMLQ
jgi:hypothetical protein